MVIFQHPITKRSVNADFRFWKRDLYRKIEQLIKKLVNEGGDFFWCEICGEFSSPAFFSKKEYITHLRLDPKHVVDFFILKMKLKKIGVEI